MLPGKAIRRSAKWGGTAAAALITAAWIASAWRHVDYIAPTGHYAAVGMGRIAFGWVDPATGIRRGFRVFEWRNKQPFFASRRFDWTFDYWSLPSQWGAQIPGWVPVLAAATGAALLWRRDAVATKRERVGLCGKCGYSLEGLPGDAPCPECGTVPPAPGATLVKGDGLRRR